MEIDLRTCRSWLFIGGADAEKSIGMTFGADVMILEFEDFTPPDQRPRARRRAHDILAGWRKAGAVAAVRVNPLSGDGIADLEAVMGAAPAIVMLPKVAGPEDIRRLASEIGRLEKAHAIPLGATRIVPNIESARALFGLDAIARADPRVTACLMASEDMTTDLGAPRSKDGGELAFARAHFHAACVAAGVLSIDYPYTYADEDGLRENCEAARRLGMTAKSAVLPAHAEIVNAHFTPAAADVAQAEEIVAAFAAARAAGADRVRIGDHLVEVPSFRNAQALLERARMLAARGKGRGPA